MLETLAIVLGAALLAVACVGLKVRFWPSSDSEEREDVAEYISMMVGVFYALILGVSLVSVWEVRSAAQDAVQTEANAAHQISVLADDLAPRQTVGVGPGIDAYASYVQDVEWPEMAAGDPIGDRGWELLSVVRKADAQLPDNATTTQEMATQEVLSQLGTLGDARSDREEVPDRTMPGPLWLGLIIGGVLSVAFMFVFEVRRSFTHGVMVMGLVGLIAFLIVLITQLDSPFSGPFAVDATPFSRYF
ncbi:hypothetical protein [Streptomyces sp. NPDC052225]|uniref:bestrophin-like domain n=1 Tax=Streptomyces sp. NPDC052225 TaxID=3154949 RepID=UPI00342E85E3